MVRKAPLWFNDIAFKEIFAPNESNYDLTIACLPVVFDASSCVDDDEALDENEVLVDSENCSNSEISCQKRYFHPAFCYGEVFIGH